MLESFTENKHLLKETRSVLHLIFSQKQYILEDREQKFLKYGGRDIFKKLKLYF